MVVGGGVIARQTKITAACAFISLSRFHPSLTGLVVCAREACGATAEITQSLQVDLVLRIDSYHLWAMPGVTMITIIYWLVRVLTLDG